MHKDQCRKVDIEQSLPDSLVHKVDNSTRELLRTSRDDLRLNFEQMVFIKSSVIIFITSENVWSG